jgi:hypothetical protein
MREILKCICQVGGPATYLKNSRHFRIGGTSSTFVCLCVCVCARVRVSSNIKLRSLCTPIPSNTNFCSSLSEIITEGTFYVAEFMSSELRHSQIQELFKCVRIFASHLISILQFLYQLPSESFYTSLQIPSSQLGF